MKKTIIISTMALCFSLLTVNAKSLNHVIVKNNLETVLKFKVSPFCASIAKGDFETVKKLIDLGADIHGKSNGMTPVMYAARYNRTDILKLLISKGVNLKAKSENGLTALTYAELSNAYQAVDIIKVALGK
ncbi:ankyrin repeat domain-containing protein [Yeosuana sp. AK3]